MQIKYLYNMRNKKINQSKSFCFLLFCSFIFTSFILPNAYAQVCSEFNSGTSQSALNIQLDKDKFIELTYKDIARTKKDDFTLSFTPAVKQVLRNASGNSNQMLSLIIKYDKSESQRPPMVPLIRFFTAGALGATNLKAESSSVDDCKEIHNFNISIQEASELFQNSRLDFDLLINVLNQGPASRIGQKFRITICLNCASSPEPTPTPGLPIGLPPEGPLTDTPSDTPPEESTTWIIVSGPGKGLQIHSEPNLPNLIVPDFNPTTQASGEVAEPDKCEGLHFHGILFGDADPDPHKCGWGIVIGFEFASDRIQGISVAITLEQRAKTKLKSEPPDIDGAIKDISDSMSEIEGLVNKVKKSVKESPGLVFTPKEANLVVRRLRSALRHEKSAVNILKSLGTKKDIDKKSRIDGVLRGLSGALFEKFEVLDEIVAVEGI